MNGSINPRRYSEPAVHTAYKEPTWKAIRDLTERRKIQNKLAERKFREQALKKKREIEPQTRTKCDFTTAEPQHADVLFGQSLTTNSDRGPRLSRRSAAAVMPIIKTSVHTRASRHADHYRYKPLNDHNSIRVLHLQPGQHGDTLVCSLELVDIYDAPAYHALSYVWGSMTESATILCDGKRMEITPNLRDALKRVRLIASPRALWVDAVCIDQSNMQERGRQVHLMRLIYKRAARVLVRLGPDGGGHSVPAFSLLCSIVTRWQGREDNSDCASFRIQGRTISCDQQFTELPSLSEPSWRSLAILYDRPWFWRLWVIQEIVLSTSATMMWGDAEVCWNWVGLASEWIRTNGCYLMRSYPMAGVYNAYLMHSMHTGAKDTDSLSFLWLMGLTRQFEAIDPRDRVFALLGLPTTDADPDHDPLFMEPDYAVPLLQIYKRLAIRIIHQSRNLKILTAVQHGPLLKEEFPSWVPQWHYSYTHTVAPSDPGVNHAAAADVPLFLEDLHAGSANTLTATGLSIDTISEASRVMSDEDFSLPGTDHLHQIWAEHIEKLDAYSTRESLEKVYCWTVTAGKDWYGMLVEDSDSHWADFLTYWRKVDPPDSSLVSTYEQRSCDAAHNESQDGDADRFLEAASNACSGRRIFITSKGHIGLGPAALRTDDRVCVLFGSIVPFVLRRRNAHFQLVGECYVNSLMQGEAISEWRKGHLTDEEFELR